jgi:hypothetical protein
MQIAKFTIHPQLKRHTPNPPYVDDINISLFYDLVSETGITSIAHPLLSPFDGSYRSDVCYMFCKGNRIILGWAYEEDEEGAITIETDRNRFLIAVKKWYTYCMEDVEAIFLYREGEFFDIQCDAIVPPNFHYPLDVQKTPYSIVCYRHSTNYYLPNIAPITDMLLWIIYELLQYKKGWRRKPSPNHDEPAFWAQFENVDIKDDKSFIRRPYSLPTAPPELIMNKDHLRDIIKQWDDLSLRDAKEITIQRDGERFTIEGKF